MTIKDIIKITSTIIGREDVVDYLNGNTFDYTEETPKTIEIMTRLSNLVINELACSFIPMKTMEKVQTTNGKVFYKDLNNKPLEIVCAYDLVGCKVDFEIQSTFVKTNLDSVNLEYSFFPPDYALEDQVGYADKDVSARVLAYGVAAEYAITQGCFKDAVMWHKRYADAIYQICSPKNTKIKARAWL